MSAFNGRFEIATLAGKPMVGVVGVLVGGLAVLLALLFMVYPVISMVCLLISAGAFFVGFVAFRLGHDASFYLVIFNHWRHRHLTTLDNRDR